MNVFKIIAFLKRERVSDIHRTRPNNQVTIFLTFFLPQFSIYIAHFYFPNHRAVSLYWTHFTTTLKEESE